MKKIVVFASGRGSNCQKIYENLVVERKIARLIKIITDNSRAGIIHWAQQYAIPLSVISPSAFRNYVEFSDALIEAVPKETDLIVLAGYLKKIPSLFLKTFPNKIVNIHPALLPAFGGKGMYGMHVHQAVWKYGAALSGVTVHLIDEKYDNGPVVLQKAVEIQHCKSPEDIAQTVLKVEHEWYWRAVEKLLTSSYTVNGRKIVWGPND